MKAENEIAVLTSKLADAEQKRDEFEVLEMMTFEV